jgi:hypothetical protein
MSLSAASLLQWCPDCEAVTASKPCDFCGGQAITCATCEKHPGCVGPDDDEAEYGDEDRARR